MEKVNYEEDLAKPQPIEQGVWNKSYPSALSPLGQDSMLFIPVSHITEHALPKKAKTMDWLLSAMEVDLKKLDVTFSRVPNSLWATLALDTVQFTATQPRTPFLLNTHTHTHTHKQQKKPRLCDLQSSTSAMVLTCALTVFASCFPFKNVPFCSLQSLFNRGYTM